MATFSSGLGYSSYDPLLQLDIKRLKLYADFYTSMTFCLRVTLAFVSKTK